MKLSKTNVVFNESEHTYTIGKKRLMGITGLIHYATGLGTYPDANEQVKNYNIPHAGARGTAVHSAIELYDTTVIFSDTFIVNWKERNGFPHTEEFDTAAALQGYIDAKESRKATALANEYNVTDGEKWASNIDQIWTIEKAKNEVVLVDTKTNNLDYYPGGKDALKKYLAWQLSIYAYLFEKQNPKIKVSGLACYWTNLKDWQIWDIERLDDSLVEAMLSAEWTELGDEIIYSISEEAQKAIDNAFPKDDSIKDILERIGDLQIQYKLIDAKLNEAKAELMALMAKSDLNSVENAVVKCSYTPATTAPSFDSTRFKAEHADLYAEYMKDSVRKESLRITIKK